MRTTLIQRLFLNGASVLAFLLLGFGFIQFGPGNEQLPAGELTVSTEAEGVRQAQMISSAFRETSRMVIPSVVKVTILDGQDKKKDRGKKPLSPFSDLLPDVEEEEEINGVGSGVLVDPHGIVLTNNHVIANGNNIVVELYDGRHVEVEEIKKDPKSDLAVLILKTKGEYPFLKFADSDRLEIGDWVLAIGNPFMLESSVSAGIVSAKRRFLGKKDRGVYIQTDAAVNPGNSGGPLVNLKGEIVGINTAIASVSGGYQGIGFAIPSNSAAWIMDQLIKNGKVKRAFIGAPFSNLSYDEGRKYNLPPRRGVRIGVPYIGSPAVKAGLKNNDIILTFDNVNIDSTETLDLLIESADVTRDHQLNVIRHNEQTPVNIPIRLEIMPDDYVPVPQTENLIEKGKHYFDKSLNVMLITLTPDSCKRLKAEGMSGVVVLSAMPGSLGWRAGLRDGMIITAINGTPVPDTTVFAQVIQKVSFANGLTLDVFANGSKKQLTIKSDLKIKGDSKK